MKELGLANQIGALSGPQKAAIVVTQMPAEMSSAVLAQLSESEVSQLSRVVASLPELDPGLVRQVMADYMGRVQVLSSVRQGGVEVAKRILRERLGVQRAEEELERLTRSDEARPFAFLHSVEPGRVAAFLSDEHPQVVAVVVAHLPADLAAHVLGALDEDKRVEVALRVGTMGKVPHDAVAAIAATLSGQLLDKGVVSEGERAGSGSGTLAAILNRAERQVERQVLAGMDTTDPELAEEVRRQLFTFEDVLALDDRTLQRVVRVIQPKTLALALKGADEAVRAPFVRNMSENAAQDLLETIESLGPVRMVEVEGAQMDIARKVRELEAEGVITVIRKGDEIVV